MPIKYETILRLAKHPNILAVKDAKGDFSEVSRVLNQTDLLYFSGDDANVLPHLAIGATGLSFLRVGDRLNDDLEQEWCSCFQRSVSCHCFRAPLARRRAQREGGTQLFLAAS